MAPFCAYGQDEEAFLCPSCGAASLFRRLPDPLARGRNGIRFIRVKMKGFLVRFDREPIGSPAIEASLEEFDP
jgi:hypothetical protein